MHRRFHDKYFDRGLRGWIISTAKKNYWRVAAFYDLEDVVQEGMLAYAICRQRYRHRVENRRHFMSLVQVVYMHRLHDMANARSLGEDIPISQIAAEGKELEALEYLAGGQLGDAELQATLASAPKEVGAFLDLFNSAQGLEELDKPLRRRKDGTRETMNERLSLLLGMPVLDIETMIRNLLGAPA